LCLLATIFSCSSTHEVTKNQTIPDNFMNSSTRTQSYRATNYGQISSLDYSKPNGEFLEPPSEAFSHFKFDNSWQDAHMKVLIYLNKNKEYSLHFQEQMISCVMLDEYLLKQKDSPKLNEAIAYYVELLLKNENSEVLIIDKAIKRLNNYWDKTKIQNYQAKIKAIASDLIKLSDLSEEEKMAIRSKIL
jgi:hypothetical protein